MTRWRIPSASPDLPPLDGFVGDVRRIFTTRRLSNYGHFSRRLERAAEKWLGGPALAFSSGDAALAALMATCPAERVVVSDWTFQSTINAVVRAGAVPVIAEPDPELLCLTPNTVNDAIGVDGAGAILATFAHGSTASAIGMMQAAKAHGRPLYFDAAHAFRPGCPIADGAAFSLSGTKVVTCGEGGLLVGPQPKNSRGGVASGKTAHLAARYFRNYGFLDNYSAEMIGVNGKLAEMPAALAVRAMARFKSAARRRIIISAVYRRVFWERFRDAQDGHVSFQKFAPDDVPKDFVVIFREAWMRKSAETSLTRARIETKRYFRPLSMQPTYRAWWPSREVQERSRALWERSLCLPLSSRMTVAQAREVAGIVAEAVR